MQMPRVVVALAVREARGDESARSAVSAGRLSSLMGHGPQALHARRIDIMAWRDN
jgi:ribosomal protein L5